MSTTTAPAAAGIQYKTTSGGLPLLAADDETGTFEALVSITGVVDDQGDIIVPGAYTQTLAERTPKGVRFHRWDRPVARTVGIEEWPPGDSRLPAEIAPGVEWPKDAGALWVKGQYNLRTRDGKDAYEDAKFYGELNQGQWSIGYLPKRGGAERRKDGVRLLKAVDLFEYSDVLHGAARQTRTLTVKDAQEPAELEPQEPELVDDERKPDEQEPQEVNSKQSSQVKAVDVLPGSLEERRDAVRAAVSQRLSGGKLPDGEPQWYVMVVGTWQDRVVVTRYYRGEDRRDSESYQVPYTVDADGALALGEPAAVDLQLQVVPSSKQQEEPHAALPVLLDLLADAGAAASLLDSHAGAKAGRVLSAGNTTRIQQAVAQLLSVLTAAGVPMDTEPGGKKQAAAQQPEQEPSVIDPVEPVEPVEPVVVLDMAEVKATLAGLHAACK